MANGFNACLSEAALLRRWFVSSETWQTWLHDANEMTHSLEVVRSNCLSDANWYISTLISQPSVLDPISGMATCRLGQCVQLEEVRASYPLIEGIPWHVLVRRNRQSGRNSAKRLHQGIVIHLEGSRYTLDDDRRQLPNKEDMA